MRKEGPSEAAFEASGYMSEEEDEVNIVKNLEQGTGWFKGKLPFKCFSCGRVGHYAARCPHNKGKMFEEGNRSYYTHVKSNDSFNGSEDIRSLMAYEKKQDGESLEEQEHEVIKLKQQVEEGRKAEEDLRNQYLEKEEQHQVEVNILKGKLEEKDKLLRFQV